MNSELDRSLVEPDWTKGNGTAVLQKEHSPVNYTTCTVLCHRRHGHQKESDNDGGAARTFVDIDSSFQTVGSATTLWRCC